MVNIDELASRFKRDSDPAAIKASVEAARDSIYAYDKGIFSQKGDFGAKSGLCRMAVRDLLFSCLYIKGSSNSLHVAFSGAKNSAHNYLTNPGMARWSYHSLYDGCFLGIDDPMYYLYPNLSLGWYYGDKERFFVKDSLQVVDRVIANNGIDRNSVTFFSSSGGGYAALMASLLYPGSLSISVNPQIFISDWNYTPAFRAITGIDLAAPDKFSRNDPIALLPESQSKHVILINLASDEDVETQLRPLLMRLNMSARYGLSQQGNLLLWLYDAPGAPSAHVSSETRAIYCAIDHIANQFKRNEDFDADSYQPLALLINETWRDIYIEKKAAFESGQSLARQNKFFRAKLERLKTTGELKGANRNQ